MSEVEAGAMDDALAADGRRPLVLVIDANPTTRLIAAALIDQFGGKVAAYGSLAEAWAEIAAGGADLIVHKPGREGSANSLREAAGAVPVVAIGGETVPNPYSPRELFEALHDALAATAGRTVALR